MQSDWKIQQIGDEMSKERLEFAHLRCIVFCKITENLCIFEASIKNPRDCRKCPRAIQHKHSSRTSNKSGEENE